MKKVWQWSIAGFVVGGVLTVSLLSVQLVGNASADPNAMRADPGLALDVLHTPPLLLGRGEQAVLSYQLVCAPQGAEPGTPCAPSGTLHLRGAAEGRFQEVALEQREDGSFSFEVPADLTAGTGFSYYATFQDGRGSSVTVPRGGSDAPEVARIVSDWTTVELGEHSFGATRAPGGTVARAAWGVGGDNLGLNDGREQSRIGPSGFDVAPNGDIVVLDQVNRRLAIYRHGQAAKHVPVDFRGGEGDVAVEADGTTWVLDDGGTQRRAPAVIAYDASGRRVGGADLAEPIGDMLRAGPNGPVVHTYPSEMWLPVGSGQDGLGVEAQARGARSGRPIPGGRELVVRASPGEVRLALVAGPKMVSAWRILSTTTLGEVQLAEPAGDGAVVIVRAWTEGLAEFRVLKLGRNGLTGSFAVAPGEWAESAPLSRFRLKGQSLYHLSTSPQGAEVVTYAMGDTR